MSWRERFETLATVADVDAAAALVDDELFAARMTSCGVQHWMEKRRVLRKRRETLLQLQLLLPATLP